MNVTEEALVFIFIEWCKKHLLDPIHMYEETYPNQPIPELLKEMVKEEMVSNAEVSDEAVYHVMMDAEQYELAEKIFSFLSQK